METGWVLGPRGGGPSVAMPFLLVREPRAGWTLGEAPGCAGAACREQGAGRLGSKPSLAIPQLGDFGQVSTPLWICFLICRMGQSRVCWEVTLLELALVPGLHCL